MKKRPSTVTVIGWVSIVLGVITFIAALLPLFGVGKSGSEAMMNSHGLMDLVLVLITRALAVVFGIFLLLGYNWARWLLLLWMGFHVVISLQGSAYAIIVHSLIFVVVLYLLFRPEANTYFRGEKDEDADFVE